VNPDIANRFVAMEARIAALEAEVAALKRHIHNTSPTAGVTGGPVDGSIR
jgi:uncharacterized protein YceH (UPF0502 family)